MARQHDSVDQIRSQSFSSLRVRASRILSQMPSEREGSPPASLQADPVPPLSHRELQSRELRLMTTSQINHEDAIRRYRRAVSSSGGSSEEESKHHQSLNQAAPSNNDKPSEPCDPNAINHSSALS